MVGSGIAPLFLTLALDADDWSLSRSCCFNPGEGAPDTRWKEGFVSPQLVWKRCRTEKSLAPARNRTLAVQAVARRYTGPPYFIVSFHWPGKSVAEYSHSQNISPFSHVDLKIKYFSPLKLNSVAWVRERTTPTERPLLVGEVSANVCG
jgi:hypothetical protein